MQIITAKEVAERTHIGINKVYALARAGKIPSARAGNKFLFTDASVDAWMQQQIENHKIIF